MFNPLIVLNNSKSSHPPSSKVIPSILPDYLAEKLNPEQLKRLKETLNQKIWVGKSQISIGEFLTYLSTNLKGCEAILFKGSVNNYILDGGKRLPLNDIDVSLIAKPGTDITALKNIVCWLVHCQLPSQILYGSYCNMSVDYLDLSFAILDTNPRCQCRVTSREINILEETVLFPKEYIFHSTLQELIKQVDIGSCEDLEKGNLKAIFSMFSLFVQGRIGDKSLLTTLYKKIFVHYQKCVKVDVSIKKEDKQVKEGKFESWLSRVVNDYMGKHIPEKENQAKLLYLLDLIFPAQWAYDSQTFCNDKNEQKNCLKAMWKVIHPLITKNLPKTFLDCKGFKSFDDSPESLEKFYVNLCSLVEFYSPNKKTLCFQMRFGKEGQEMLFPIGKETMKDCQSKWENTHLLVPKVDLTSKMILQTGLGKPLEKADFLIKRFQGASGKKTTEALKKLSDIFEMSAFGKCKFSKKVTPKDLLNHWKQLLTKWSSEIQTQEEYSSYLNALFRIISLSYSIDPESSDDQDLLDLYFLEFVQQCNQSNDKKLFFKTYALPFLEPARFIEGVLSRVSTLEKGGIYNCISLLSPWIKEIAEKSSGTKYNERLYYFLKIAFGPFLSSADCKNLADRDLLIDIITILSQNRAFTEKEVKAQTTLPTDLRSIQLNEQRCREVRVVAAFIEQWKQQMIPKNSNDWKITATLLNYLLIQYQPSKDEGRAIWIYFFQQAIKSNQHVIANSLFEEMVESKWLNPREEYAFGCELLQTTLTSDHIPLIEKCLETSLIEKNNSLEQLLHLIEFWNKVVTSSSNVKATLMETGLFSKLLQRISILINKSPLAGRTILLWIHLNKPLIKDLIQSEQGNQKANLLFQILQKTSVLYDRYDIQILEQFSQSLSLISSQLSEEKIFDLASEILSRYFQDKTNLSLSLIEQAETISNQWSFQDRARQEAIVLYFVEAYLQIGQEGASRLADVFSQILSQELPCSDKAKGLLIAACTQLLEQNKLSSLEHLLNTGRKLSVFKNVNDKNVKGCFGKIKKRLMASDEVKKSLTELTILQSIISNFKEVLTDQDKEAIATQYLNLETPQCQWAMEWMIDSKTTNCSLLLLFFNKTNSSELIDKGIVLLLKGIDQKAIKIKDIQNIPLVKMVQLAKDAKSLKALMAHLRLSAISGEFKDLNYLAEAMLALAKKYPDTAEQMGSFIEFILQTIPTNPLVNQLFNHLPLSQKKEVPTFIPTCISYGTLSKNDLELCVANNLLRELDQKNLMQLVRYCIQKGYICSKLNMEQLLTEKVIQALDNTESKDLLAFCIQTLKSDQSAQIYWQAVCRLVKYMNKGQGGVPKEQTEALSKLIPNLIKSATVKNSHLVFAKRILILLNSPMGLILQYAKRQMDLTDKQVSLDKSLVNHLTKNEQTALQSLIQLHECLAQCKKGSSKSKEEMHKLLQLHSQITGSSLEAEKENTFKSIYTLLMGKTFNKDSWEKILSYISTETTDQAQTLYMIPLVITEINKNPLSSLQKKELFSELSSKLKAIIKTEPKIATMMMLLAIQWEENKYLLMTAFDTAWMGNQEVKLYTQSYLQALKDTVNYDDKTCEIIRINAFNQLTNIFDNKHVPASQANSTLIYQLCQAFTHHKMLSFAQLAEHVIDLFIVNMDPKTKQTTTVEFFSLFHLEKLTEKKNPVHLFIFASAFYNAMKKHICSDVSFPASKADVILSSYLLGITKFIEQDQNKVLSLASREQLTPFYKDLLVILREIINYANSTSQKSSKRPLVQHCETCIESIVIFNTKKHLGYANNVLCKELLDWYGGKIKVCSFDFIKLKNYYETCFKVLLNPINLSQTFDFKKNLETCLKTLLSKQENIEHSLAQVAFTINLFQDYVSNLIDCNFTVDDKTKPVISKMITAHSRDVNKLLSFSFDKKYAAKVDLMKREVNMAVFRFNLFFCASMKNVTDEHVRPIVDELYKQLGNKEKVPNPIYISTALWQMLDSTHFDQKKIELWLDNVNFGGLSGDRRQIALRSLISFIAYGYDSKNIPVKEFVIKLGVEAKERFSLTDHEFISIMCVLKELIPAAANAITKLIPKPTEPSKSKKK